MANRFYLKGIKKIISGDVNLTSDTIKIALVTSSYTVNTTTHEYYSSVSAYAVATTTLTSKTFADGGIFDAADPTFSGVTHATGGTYLVIYKSSGSDATSPLLCYIDTDVSGLPTGALVAQNVTVVFDNGTNKIFNIAG